MRRKGIYLHISQLNPLELFSAGKLLNTFEK